MTASPHPFATSHAVVIGIDRYPSGIPKLRTAVNDARRLAALLSEGHRYHVTTLLDDDARGARIMQLLTEELPQRVGPEDRVLFYWAGHGVARDGETGPNGYLLPSDAQPRDAATFLHMPQVHDALMALPCRHMLVILDSCFSGAFRWSATRDFLPAHDIVHEEKYARFVRDPAWLVLTSAASDEVALDSLSSGALGNRGDQDGHSPFAHALFRALSGDADVMGGRDGDGLVTAHELFVYIDEHLQTAALGAGMRQTPGLWPLRKHGKGQYVFFVPGRSLALPPAPPLTLESNPWRGLNAYEAADRALFFGRAEQMAALRRHVDAHPLSIVLGASGTGKSSLVKAGLVPSLEDDGWRVLPSMRPGPSPYAALAEVLGAPIASPHTQADGELDDLERQLRARLRDQLDARAGVPVALVIDQWEELITLTRSAQERDRFLALVASLVADHGDALRVIITLRSDFESNFDRTVFGAHWPAGRFVVSPFSRDELRAVIEQPAARQVLFFDPPTLVDTLVDEVIATPGGLPLLSFALSEMYIAYLRRRGDDRAITQADYEALGGVAGALRSRAEAEYAALGELEQATLARVMLRMVVADGGHLARRRVTDAELEFADADENARRATVISRLTEARLLVRGREPDGEAFVEPAHDALVRGWGRLIRWVQEASTAAVPLVTRQKLTTAALDWTRADRSAKSGLLWRDPVRSAQLAPLVQARVPWLNARELAFAARSVRRRRIERALSIVVTLVVAVVAAVAVWQGKLAQRAAATAARLVGQSYLLDALAAGASRRVAVANAAAALEAVADNTTVDVDLYSWLSHVAPPLAIVEHQGAVTAAAFSPDGTRLATASRDSTARLWDASTGAPVGAPMQHGAVVVTVSFSRDGAHVVTASHDGTARVWDATTGAPVSAPMAHGSSVNDAAFSPDGRLVVTGGEDGIARVFDARSGEPVGPPMRHGAMPYEAMLLVRFSRDGRRIVTVRNHDPLNSIGRAGPGRIWEWPSGTHLRSLFDSAGHVVATNGDLILTQSAGGTAWQWESGSGTRRGAALPAETGIVAATFSPGDTLVATAFADGTAQVWDARTGLQLGDRLRHDGAIRSLAFNAAGTMVVTASDDSTAKVWDAGSGALIGSPLVHDMDLWSAVFSADGRRVVAAGPPVPVRRLWGSMSSQYFNPPAPPTDFTATVWPVRPALTGTRLPDAALATLEIRRDGRRALSIRSSGDEQWVQHAALDEDGGDAELLVMEARLWDMRSGAPVGAPLRHGGHVFSAVFSADGAVIATAGSDSTVRLWNAEDGRPLGAPLKHPAAVLAAGLDATGARVVSAAADGQLRVWDVRTGTLAVPPTPTIDRVREVAFSPDGAWVLLTMSSPWSSHMQFALEASSLQPMGLLAAGDLRPQSISADGSRGVVVNRDNNDMPVNGAVLHVSNAAGTTAIPLPLSGVVTASAFSMDGSLLVTASTDSTARIWHAATGAAQSVPLAHRAAVAAVAFSLDGTRLVTASADSTMRVWDTRTGTPVGAPLALGDSVHSVRFSPDGQYVITRTMHDTTALHVVRTVNEANRAGVLDLAQLVLNARMRGPRDFVRGVPERAARLQAWRTRARGWADAAEGSFEQWAHWYLADPAAGAPQPERWPQSARR